MKRKRIEVPIADGVAWLERLTPRQLIAVGDRLWHAKRKRLLADLKDAEVDSTGKVAALQDLDNSRGLLSEIVRQAVAPEGALELIAEAATGPNVENADGLPDAFCGSAEEAIKIALELIGAEVGGPPPKAEAGKKRSRDG